MTTFRFGRRRLHSRRPATRGVRRVAFESLEARLAMDAAAAVAVTDAAEGEATDLPDFTLEDVNPASPRFEQAVSPSDYQGKATAWYFGYST